MQLPNSPRLATSLAVGATLVVTVALTLGILGFTRAGTVSVLPVTGQQSGIAVCGHGKATTKPDQARIQAGVHATSASAQDARGQAAAAMMAVIAALKSHGVADADIQTDYFAIQPQYTYDSSGPRQTGYMATNNVTATIRHVDDAGKVVDAVTQAGGNAVVVSGIQFFSGDPATHCRRRGRAPGRGALDPGRRLRPVWARAGRLQRRPGDRRIGDDADPAGAAGDAGDGRGGLRDALTVACADALPSQCFP